MPAFVIASFGSSRITNLESVTRLAEIHRDAVMDLPGVMSFGIGGARNGRRETDLGHQPGAAFVIGVRTPDDAPSEPLTLANVEVQVKVIGTPRRVSSEADKWRLTALSRHET